MIKLRRSPREGFARASPKALETARATRSLSYISTGASESGELEPRWTSVKVERRPRRLSLLLLTRRSSSITAMSTVSVEINYLSRLLLTALLQVFTKEEVEQQSKERTLLIIEDGVYDV